MRSPLLPGSARQKHNRHTAYSLSWWIATPLLLKSLHTRSLRPAQAFATAEIAEQSIKGFVFRKTYKRRTLRVRYRRLPAAAKRHLNVHS